MNDFQKTPFSLASHPGKKKKKKKRAIMKEFTLTEISAVDTGAQEGAVAVLMKRTDNTLVEKLVVLTSSVQDHQHAVDLHSYNFEDGGGMTSWQGETTESQHNHDFVINADGTITIGEANGHTHEVDLVAAIQRLQLEAIVQVPVNVIQMRSPLVKREAGKDFSASDYAYTPDPNDPRTWKHRLADNPGSLPSRRRVGNAVAALQKRQIPASKQMSVIRRVRTAWAQTQKRGSTNAQMPSILKRVAS